MATIQVRHVPEDVHRAYRIRAAAAGMSFGAEAASAVRTLVSSGQLDAGRAAAALEQIRSVRANQYPFEPFARRAWQLRDNLTVDNAWYVAHAEWLGTELVTADTALQTAPGPTCMIRRPDAHA